MEAHCLRFMSLRVAKAWKQGTICLRLGHRKTPGAGIGGWAERLHSSSKLFNECYVWSCLAQSGMTALHQGCIIGSLPAVELLLRAGADVHARDMVRPILILAIAHGCQCTRSVGFVARDSMATRRSTMRASADSWR